ncbi:MAG: family 20 glycosylhydrolase [Opitutales bacterium]|nr:family 20 glycosylhydrolase [Opitutales bacterium]
MKTYLIILVTILFMGGFCYSNSKILEKSQEDFIKSRLSPLPKKSQFFNEYYTLNDDDVIAISTTKKLSDKQKDYLEDTLETYFGFEIDVKNAENADNANLGEEGYKIVVDKNGINILAKDFVGARQSLKTLRQMSEVERDGKGRVFAHCNIVDYATLSFRGIHLCMLPETSIESLEKYIRLASYYKFNYVVIEPWGTFPFKSHPFAFQDKQKDRAKLKRLIDLCWDLGITPIPQFSVLGHATQARVMAGKHAVLSASPEYADMFEPLGWSYCMKSKKAEKVLKELVAEIHEFYGKPPFFHLGCDEAYEMGTCYKCRQHNKSELFVEHLKKFSDYTKSLGARAIIWHDMLLDKKDPRWKKDVAQGDATTANALKTLSRDIIIADWQYSYRDKKQTFFPTSIHFKEAGFDVIVCPWEVKTGIYALAKSAKDNKLFGFLETTWHHVYSTKMDLMFYQAGNAAWNGGEPVIEGNYAAHRIQVSRHIIDVENDGKLSKYEVQGKARYQVHIDMPN